MQYQDPQSRRLQFSRATLPPARSQPEPEVNQRANAGATSESSSMMATLQQVEPRRVSQRSLIPEHPDVHDTAKEGSSNAAQMSPRSSTPAFNFSPNQETSTTRESADVGTLTSTTALAQAPVIQLPASEASAGAGRPQTTATASTRPRPPLQLPSHPRFSVQGSQRM